MQDEHFAYLKYFYLPDNSLELRKSRIYHYMSEIKPSQSYLNWYITHCPFNSCCFETININGIISKTNISSIGHTSSSSKLFAWAWTDAFPFLSDILQVYHIQSNFFISHSWKVLNFLYSIRLKCLPFLLYFHLM